MEDRHPQRGASGGGGQEVAAGPQRTCVGCRRKGDQADFLRVAATADGSLTVRGKGGAGRSAYLCKQVSCIEAGMKSGRLERALRTKFEESARARLRNELECKLR
ncbi:MAG: YlxR family protein [Fimbriimonas ginsengisoli]|uniref:YlxR family protein n=1 Tax=Fimbriimonas ginsengisoli TaxID=1005039 RepID=A0A931LV67_FIMGI|nr:YlxR family protein [Fimbriimonas ginsengisoli]